MNDEESIMLGVAAVLALAGFMLSFYTLSGNAAYWWDEAEYGILSKSLSTNGFFGFFGGQSYRPPFLPVYMAIFRSIFGEIAWNLVIPLFTALSILAVFMVAKRLFDWKAGVIASLLLLFSTLFIFYSGRFLAEIPGIFFSALSAYYFFLAFETGRKRDFLLLALFSLCAFLVFYRFSMMLASFVLFALIFRTRKILQDIPAIGVSLIVFLVLLFPLLLYSNTYFGSPQGLFAVSYLGQQAEPLEWFALLLPHILSNIFVVVLLALAIIYGIAYGNRQLRYFALLSLIVFITASVLLNHKEDRYLMPLFPVAFIAIGAFASQILSAAYSKLKTLSSEGQKLEISAIQILFALLVLLLLYPATFGNVSAAFQLYEAKKPSFGDVKEAAIFVRDSSARNEVLMTDSVTAMFHSDRFSKGFNGVNITAFLEDMEKPKPSYLLLTAYESRDNYINALNNFRNIKTPSNSVEYVLLHPEKFQLLKIFPSESQPYVLVFKVAG